MLLTYFVCMRRVKTRRILIGVAGALVVALIVGCCVYRCLKARRVSEQAYSEASRLVADRA